MRILFSMPASFIRTEAQTNPFFDPIIKACERRDLDWKVLVPCRRNAIGYDANQVIDARTFELCGLWFWRLVRIFNRQAKPAYVYTVFGKIWRWVTLRRYRADLIVSVAGQFAEQLEGVNPSARFADLQHGVIYSKHQGYFDGDRRLNELYRKMSKHEFWLYGQGYADCFFKHPGNHKWLDGRVKVIGDVLNAESVAQCGIPNFETRKALVCMLQFNNSYPMNELLKMKELWEQYLETNRSVIEENNLDVLIRHHPRFGNVVDFSDWDSRFPWAHVDKRTWNEVYDDALCCVGFNSTTVIEAAGRGIPVIILDGSPIGKDSYFAETFVTDEFHYPFQKVTLSEWIAYEENKRRAIAKALMQWHQRFYTPFDKENCLKLLKGER